MWKKRIFIPKENGRENHNLHSPTTNRETLCYKRCKFAVFNMPGKVEIEDIGKEISSLGELINIYGFIFVIDFSDKDKIEDAAKEPKKLLAYEAFKDCPVLGMANKLDLNTDLEQGDVTSQLGRESIKGRAWLV